MLEKVNIVTYGCKLNQAESEVIGEKLSSLNYIVEYDKSTKSDILIINSCTVTSEAERKIRQLIRKTKREKPDTKVVVVGCYTHTDTKSLLENGVDLILGNLEKKYIENYIDKNGVFVDLDYWHSKNEKIFLPQKPYNNYSRYFLPIEEGCLEFCTYCRIIFARGNKIRSVSKDEIFKKIDSLIKKGVKEFIITGINLTYYGYGTDYNLLNLIMDIEKKYQSQKIRFRISSLYPDFINENIIQFLNESKIFEKHIHLSLQHVSTKVLENMGRKYNEKYLINLFDMIFRINDIFSISSDIIVGFPGETNEDFEILLEFINKYPFSRVHAFRYSSRPNTKASKMPHQISGEIKKARMKQLQQYIKNSNEQYLKKLINSGITPEILIEKKNNQYSYGYDEYYIYHKILNNSINLNDFHKVKINKIENTGVISSVL
ncbi:hypothetical protein XO10_01665 [Marinitoga sp. 1135]|nr:hypothetical protein [Marinitoga sp. 1135]